MSAVLAAIRSMLSDPDLRAHMASRTLLHAQAAGGFDPAKLLTLETLEQSMARGIVAPNTLRVFGSYTRLDPEHAGVVKNGKIRPAALRSLARQGSTLVVNNAHKLTPELWDLCCGLERWLGTHVTFTAVASFGNSGIEMHYDHPDVIVVHLGGSKTWNFFGPPVAQSAGVFHDYKGERPTEITQSATMMPGDVMYVPSGLFHRCSPGPYSLHLGIAVQNAASGDYARYLSSLALEEAETSSPIQAFLGDDAIRDGAEAMKARIIARINAADPLAWFARHQAQRARTHSFEISPSDLRIEDGVAVLNVTMGPALSADGKYSAGGTSIIATPILQELIEVLRRGPCNVSAISEQLVPSYSHKEVVDGVTRLVDIGFVTIQSA